jgi:2-polyprenyl-3-methyl-5-hydroxy-6-metoxy-1,4-benzoquinol methylase
MIMNKNCPICGYSISVPIYTNLRRCEECGFVWYDLALSAEELKAIYSKDYFSGEEYVDYKEEERILKIGFHKINNYLIRLLRLRKNTHKPKMLEIGSAYGFFLDIASSYFDVTGVELNNEASEYASSNNHKVLLGDFMKIIFDESDYDVIVCLATLEHLQYPSSFMEKVGHILKPGGILYCTTIDINSFFARLCGSHWRMIHPPTHISYFSSKSLCYLAEHNGLEILKCKPIWQIRGSENLLAKVLKQNGLGNRIFSILQRTPIMHIPIPFNFGDIIALTARKIK